MNYYLNLLLEKKSKLYQILIDENENLKKEYYKSTQKKFYNDFYKNEKLNKLQLHFVIYIKLGSQNKIGKNSPPKIFFFLLY